MLSKIEALLRREDGFTLVEMLAAIAVLTLLLAMFAELLSVTVTRSGRSREQGTLQTEARGSLDEFTVDLRQAICNGTTSPVTTATANQITFTSPDKATPYHLRQVSYQLNGSNFQRAFSTSTNTGGPPWTLPAFGPWQTLVGSITSSSPFTYYDSSGAVTTDPLAVARVDLSISITPKSSPGDGATTYTQTANLRTPTC
jgi:prepilin-type N-terminal cleavage/methylation domain-containing protein